MSPGELNEPEFNSAPRPTSRHVPFAEAFRFWLKLGFISFGGPAGQIAIMHRELVERRRWLGDKRFLHALNYCMLLPGPEAHQLAIYIGWLMHRTLGGIVAGIFFVLPSIFILLGLSYIYAAYGDLPVVVGVLNGFKPVVVAIVVEALFKIAGRSLKRAVHYAIAVLAFVAIFLLHIPFPLIIVVAAVAGLAGTKFFPAYFAPLEPATRPAAEGALRGRVVELPLVIKDDSSPAEHTGPNARRSIAIAAVGLGLWLIPFAALAAWNGLDGFHTREYGFFTLAAFVTFGGAYAVLAYVMQAVTTAPYNWITPAQAVDGLALAETTPGPLIMVLQFVGFMAGWNNPPAGVAPAVSGMIGALVATYTTFLPSFLFIFLGAPYIERLRDSKVWNASLTSVTAAVVGVILNLALVFGATVIFPQAAGINWFALMLSVAAFTALYRFRIDVMWVILAGGVAGLISGAIPA